MLFADHWGPGRAKGSERQSTTEPVKAGFTKMAIDGLLLQKVLLRRPRALFPENLQKSRREGTMVEKYVFRGS